MAPLFSRGQGAMEYLMTYGWALLVILILGVFLWHIGVLNISTSIAPTSQGFHTLRPVLATCRMEKGVWRPDYYGFGCQFTNNVGREIRIRDLNLTVDGKSCRYMQIDVVPTFTAGMSDYLYRQCNSENLDCPLITCGGLQKRCLCPPGNDCYLTVPKDKQFSVMTLSNILAIPAGPIGLGPCANILSGHKYEVKVGFTYEVEVGDVKSLKMDEGIIQLSGD